MAAGDFDESDTPPPMLFDSARETDPRARQWAQREVEYVSKISQLQAQLGASKQKVARLILKVNELKQELERKT